MPAWTARAGLLGAQAHRSAAPTGVGSFPRHAKLAQSVGRPCGRAARPHKQLRSRQTSRRRRFGEPRMARPPRIRFPGRILYLTEDADLLRKQLAGQDLAYDPARPLIDNISHRRDHAGLGLLLLRRDARRAIASSGLRGGRRREGRDQERRLRRHRQRAARRAAAARARRRRTASSAAGIQLVIAKSIEKIYGQNCQNIGLLTSTDFGLHRAHRGAARRSRIEEFTRGLDPDQRRHRSSRAVCSSTTSAPAPAMSRRPRSRPQRAADDDGREDLRGARDRRRAHGRARRPRGRARRRAVRAHRRALQPRVRHADGRLAVSRRASARTRRVASPRACSRSATT